MEKLPLQFTLCFLTRGDEVLMLYRNRPPNQGLWNGVGGHIEPGELPESACRREVEEETGFHLDAVRFAGLLTWHGFEIPAGGLYLYTAPAPAGQPVASDEGFLQWQPRADVITSPAVVDNLHFVLPAILNGAPPQVYHFDYRNGQIIGHTVQPLPAWLGNDLLAS